MKQAEEVVVPRHHSSSVSYHGLWNGRTPSAPRLLPEQVGLSGGSNIVEPFNFFFGIGCTVLAEFVYLISLCKNSKIQPLFIFVEYYACNRLILSAIIRRAASNLTLSPSVLVVSVPLVLFPPFPRRKPAREPGDTGRYRSQTVPDAPTITPIYRLRLSIVCNLLKESGRLSFWAAGTGGMRARTC